MSYNPNKKLNIEIEMNDMEGLHGFTIWHIVNGIRKRTMSRNADGKDFDWMDAKQEKDFVENRKYKFQITAAQASEYFEYIY